MDRFRVAAKDTTLLDTSHLVSEMHHEATQVPAFRVLLDGDMASFHDVDGGYDGDGDVHIVNLIHDVQGPSSPTSNHYPDRVEAHMLRNAYYLTVTDSTVMGEYPDENFVLSLEVSDYMKHQFTFCGPFTDDDVDRRETRYEFE